MFYSKKISLCLSYFRFDSEFQLLMDELRQEKSLRERIGRERKLALGDKYTMEQNLSVRTVFYIQHI